MEKAYAKLHGCYENLKTGYIDYGLRDLTGGMCMKLKFNDKSTKMKLSKGKLWGELMAALEEGSLAGCSFNSGNAGEVEHDRGDGILAVCASLFVRLSCRGRQAFTVFVWPFGCLRHRATRTAFCNCKKLRKVATRSRWCSAATLGTLQLACVSRCARVNVLTTRGDADAGACGSGTETGATTTSCGKTTRKSRKN